MLLSEILRPTSLDDIYLPNETISSLRKMQESGTPMNLLFYGKPGIGKTSAAKTLLVRSDVLEVNGSFNRGEKSLVSEIGAFASTLSLVGKPKVVLIDEADYLPASVQNALRYIIEQVHENCRFVLTANNLGKLSEPIRSRCHPINFDIPPVQRGDVIDRVMEQYCRKLTAAGIDYNSEKVREIILLHFPDLRAVANRLQIELI